MYIHLHTLPEEFGAPLKGLVHVGANLGQEIGYYVSDCGLTKLTMFEPLPHVFAELEKQAAAYEDRASIQLHNVALGSEPGVAKINVADNSGASSSLLEPTLHKTRHKHVQFDEVIDVPVHRVQDHIAAGNDANILVVDVQGFELEVLKGCGAALFEQFDYITVEVSRVAMYQDSALVGDLDTYLAQQGFQRVKTVWATREWGDALYVKSRLIPTGYQAIEHEQKKPRSPLRAFLYRLIGRG